MKRFGLVAAAIAAVLVAGTARADDSALCQGLKSAWTAARADPNTVRTVKLAGADRCSFSDSDLRCFWRFSDPQKARRIYDRFKAVATACMAPLGLTAVHKVLHGVETTSLVPEADRDPNVDVFHPPTGAVVGIAIVTAD